MLCFQGVTLKSVMLEFLSIEHNKSDRTAFPHIMFHDYNYTFSSHLPKTTFSRSCQKPLFFTIDKSHYSRSSLEFFLRLLKAMLFPSPFFPRYFSTAFHKSQFSCAIHK